jgi:hypothetical protein
MKRADLIEIALAVLIVAICAPGVIWWLLLAARFVWGPLP